MPPSSLHAIYIADRRSPALPPFDGVMLSIDDIFFTIAVSSSPDPYARVQRSVSLTLSAFDARRAAFFCPRAAETRYLMFLPR